MTSSTYWPHLRDEILRTTPETAHPSLQCMICLGDMGSREEASHEAVALPCGHLFGKFCMEEWVASFTGRSPPSCPTCRAILIHPGCGHVVQIIPVPTIIAAQPQNFCQTFARRPDNISKALRYFSSAVQSYNLDNANRVALQKFPATIPEGAVIRHSCSDCHVHELLRVYTTIVSPMSMFSLIAATEFLGFTAKAGGERWVLHNRGMRATVVRTLELQPELPKICEEIRAFMERTEKSQFWPVKDLEGLEFTMCVCRWEDPSGWT